MQQHFGQQQDVFPERKRGWEEGPNVDLFLRLSFLFRFSRSRRCMCAQSPRFSQHFAALSHFIVSDNCAQQHGFGNCFFHSLIGGPLKIWGISCCLTLINAQHLYQPTSEWEVGGSGGGAGTANRLQMAVEFHNLGVKQRREKSVDAQIRSMEWKPQNNQHKTPPDIFNQT